MDNKKSEISTKKKVILTSLLLLCFIGIACLFLWSNNQEPQKQIAQHEQQKEKIDYLSKIHGLRNWKIAVNSKDVDFLEGDIENIPLPDNTADVIVSNCVLNLLPQKNIIFKEIYRVLKPGGHFCISDVVLNGIFPKEFTDNAAMYAGCIASAIQKEDYLAEIEKVNFTNIRVERTKTVIIPDEVLYEHLDENTIQKYKSGNVGIYSITVTGEKQ